MSLRNVAGRLMGRDPIVRWLVRGSGWLTFQQRPRGAQEDRRTVGLRTVEEATRDAARTARIRQLSAFTVMAEQRSCLKPHVGAECAKSAQLADRNCSVSPGTAKVRPVTFGTLPA